MKPHKQFTVANGCQLTLAVVFLLGILLLFLADADSRTLASHKTGLRAGADAAPAGGQQEVWDSRYNGPGNGDDAPIAIGVDRSGNVYVTGSSLGTALPDYDYATVKYDSAGQEQWVRRYGGAGNDSALAMIVDASGNVYVTGGVYDPDTDYDFVTIKYSAAGEQQWVAIFNGPGNGADAGKTIAVDGAGNVYVAGYTTAATGDLDYATIKYDSSGNQFWVAYYNVSPNSNDNPAALAVDDSGNVYVTGGSTGQAVTPHFATVKYSSDGMQQWVAEYTGPGNYDDAKAIAIDKAGSAYVTGSSMGANGYFDYATIKYDSFGQQGWVQRYNGTGDNDDFAVALRLDSATNVIVTGQSYGPKNLDFATVKYDSEGQQQWTARFDAGFDDFANSVATDGAGNVYVTGGSVSPDPDFNYNYTTIKYDPAGAMQWTVAYDAPAHLDDSGTAITVDDSDNVYVTGGSVSSENGTDYVTIKYSQSGSPTPTPAPRATPTPRPRPTARPRP